MKNKLLCLLPFALLFSFCTNKENKLSQKQNEYHIIPLPTELIPQTGQFVLDENTKIVSDALNNSMATAFAKMLEKETGLQLAISEKSSSKDAILFQIDDSITEKEGYAITVDPYLISIRSKTPQGAFYAVQTLRQLMTGKSIPAVKITDAPRFPYRGMHLDVARHFYDVAAVKKYIDQLAYHKFNYFHWHLTEDQGWRIEIKKYPKLTEIGAYRNGTLIGHYNDQPHQFDGKRYGGFYTQAQIKEVINYAADRFITVIPEIELPGHAQAALAAYPEFGCTGEQLEVLQKWGVSENVYCPKEETFAFLEDILTEVIDLFPSPYIHIGGDECPKAQWEKNDYCQTLMKKEGLKDTHELQSYFIRRIEKFINSKGRKMIGWDEILEGGLAPNATVMSWRGIKGGIEAAKSGHDVVMTPTTHCYFDYYQSDHPDEPLAIGGLLPVKKVYNYEPIPEELTADEAKYILGAQGNLWTEYITTMEKLEYMMLPRACALAEVVWSPKTSRNFDDFVERLTVHTKRLTDMGLNVANHLYDLKTSIQPKDGKVELSLAALAKNAIIYNTLDASEPSINSNLYKNPISINTNTTIKAQAFVDAKKAGRAWSQKLDFHKLAGKKIELKVQPHTKYSGGGNGSIINGVLGSNERYGDAEWLGFDGKNLEAIIDLQKAEKLESLAFRFFKGEGQWIYLPKAIRIFASDDGTTFKKVGEQTKITSDKKVAEVTVQLEKFEKQYLKIVVDNFGTIPEGAQGAGNKAWLFVDEIIAQ